MNVSGRCVPEKLLAHFETVDLSHVHEVEGRMFEGVEIQDAAIDCLFETMIFND